MVWYCRYDIPPVSRRKVQGPVSLSHLLRIQIAHVNKFEDVLYISQTDYPNLGRGHLFKEKKEREKGK